MTERDYGQIMYCRACGWRGPFYLTKPASIYPGRVSCPDCGSERTEVDDHWVCPHERGMHGAVLRHLAEVGQVDLRKISEPLRQRLIDLAMREPALVNVDADRVFLTDAGKREGAATMTERDELAHAIHRAWMKDERWKRLDLAAVSEGKPFAFFWAEIAAQAARAHSEKIAALTHGEIGEADGK